MLSSALPASAVNPAHSSYNGTSTNPAPGSADGAPDGFARLLDQAGKPDTGYTPERPAEPARPRVKADDNGGPDSDGNSSNATRLSDNEAEPGTVDVRNAPWQPGSKPMLGLHPPGTPPVRLPPVAGDGAGPGDALDTLRLSAAAREARSAGAADGSADASAGLQDTAAASLLTTGTAPPAPTALDASALLTDWHASAATAAAANALAATGGASNTPDSTVDGAPGHAAIAAPATTATRLVAGLTAAGNERGPSAAHGNGRAERPDRLPPTTANAAQTGGLDGTAAATPDSLGDAEPADAAGAATARGPGARRHSAAAGAAAQNVAPMSGATTEQAAALAAGPTTLTAAARAANPPSSATGEGSAIALEAGRRSGSSGNGPDTAAGTARREAVTSISVSASARASRATGSTEAGTASTADSASALATPFKVEARNGTNPGAHGPAHADLHGGVAAATNAAVAPAALAVSREAGSGLARSSEAERGGTAAAAASTTGVALGSALAWVTTAAAGTPAPAAASDGRLAASPGSPDFAPQLAAHISTFVRDGLLHARLELNPGEMGPLTVQIQLDGNAARVHLAAEHADTRAALEQAMPQLAGSLRENGLTLSGGGVFEQPRQQQAPAGEGRNNSNGNQNGSSAGSRVGRGGTARDGLNGLSGATGAPGRRQLGVVDLVA